MVCTKYIVSCDCDALYTAVPFRVAPLQITPAHDPNDYLCGKRHNLPFITVLGLDGAMNAQVGLAAGDGSAQITKTRASTNSYCTPISDKRKRLQVIRSLRLCLDEGGD